jgi:L-ascorbate metabolism protein UlaG (beta-lactamase superfamily)
MDYKEAAELTNTIKPKTVIPTHYGSVVGSKDDFNKFKKLVDKGIEVVEKIKL